MVCPTRSTEFFTPTTFFAAFFITGTGRAIKSTEPISKSANIENVSPFTPIATRLTSETARKTSTITREPNCRKAPQISPDVASKSVFLASDGVQRSTPQVVNAPTTAPPIFLYFRTAISINKVPAILPRFTTWSGAAVMVEINII